jgi:thiamine pyrophosphate-dependent acetolactate synthase large subunit-like protein
MLRRSDYHRAAEGLGAKGMMIAKSADAAGVLNAAIAETRKGTPVVVNAHLAQTDFRKGSISM